MSSVVHTFLSCCFGKLVEINVTGFSVLHSSGGTSHSCTSQALSIHYEMIFIYDALQCSQKATLAMLESVGGDPRVVGVYRLKKWNENETLGSLHNVCVVERKNTLVTLQTSRAWCHKSDPITGGRRWMFAPDSWKESKRKHTVNLSTTRLNCKGWLLASSRLLPANNCFLRKES